MGGLNYFCQYSSFQFCWMLLISWILSILLLSLSVFFVVGISCLELDIYVT